MFDAWSRLGSVQLSPDGTWITYENRPLIGDPTLYIKQPTANRSIVIERGKSAQMSANSEVVAYRIAPAVDSVRTLKLAKKKKSDLPKDTLAIRVLAQDTAMLFPLIKSFEIAESNGNWVAMHFDKAYDKKMAKEKAKAEAADKGKKKKKKKKKKKGADTPALAKKKTGGSTLKLLDPISNASFSFSDAADYELSMDGSLVALISAFSRDTIDSTRVHVFNTLTQKSSLVFEGIGKAKGLAVDSTGSQLAFLFTADTSKTGKTYQLYHWKSGQDKATEAINESTAGMPEGWAVSEFGSLQFSRSGKRLYFGTNVKPVPDPKDTLLADEKYKLDIWHYKDVDLQPRQLLELEREKRRSYGALFHVDSKKMVQLEDEKFKNVRTDVRHDDELFSATVSEHYRYMTQWETPSYRDYYTVNANTGAKELVLEKQQYPGRFSPSRKLFYWYDPDEQQWFVKTIGTNEKTLISGDIPDALYDEENDVPQRPYPHGLVAFGVNDAFVLIATQYGLWKVDPKGRKPAIDLTNGFGKQNNIELSYQNLDFEQRTLGKSPFILLKGFNRSTKGFSFYQVDTKGGKAPKLLYKADKQNVYLRKAKNSDVVVMRNSTFTDYPEVELTDLTFKSPKMISQTNPQQNDFIWGTSELVNWKGYDGRKLEGLMIKPENYDPNTKYPLMVYFYDRNSQNLHRYYSPRPSASTINPVWYASNGYMVFIPDIFYGVGHPGKDAYNCVVSGTRAMFEQYAAIDSTKVGIQGQSWGGYQTAQIITQTPLYAAAMAGAPVSNMTSAYGGIRWGSGLSRMFQYEKTQSRIGSTLWENPELYIENSPVFHLPKVTTPLLIMHNDKDGAVPWYQGIELFMGMKRLEKPVWMLNYNGDAHNLRRTANKKDLTIRMQQFFDHFLKGAPAPVWLDKGLPAVKKGKETGYDLIEK